MCIIFVFSTSAQQKNKGAFDDWENHLRNATDEFSWGCFRCLGQAISK
jgi:hypothetical protein